MKKKILIAVFILFTFVAIVNINKVSARGVVSQGYIVIDRGNGITEPALVFRTFTTPLNSTVEKYYNKVQNSSYALTDGYNYYYNGWKKSKWAIDLQHGNNWPGYGQFSTIKLAFHKQELGAYDNNGSGANGYNVATQKLSYDVATVGKAYQNSYYQRTNTWSRNNYNSSNVYYEINRMVPTGLYNINYGTGLATKGLYNGDITEYRYSIVNINGANVYVADNIILANHLSAIRRANGYARTTYVSEILSTQYNGIYQVAKTPSNLYNVPVGWSSRTRGRDEGSKGMGSIINMYDNILEFPEMSKRTVVVRHINIGKNTGISTQIVRNASRIASNNLTLRAKNPNETKWGSNRSSRYTGYEEYYEGALYINQGIEKDALKNTTTYKCIGSNVATADSLSAAQRIVDGKVSIGSYNKNATTVSVAAKSESSKEDYTVIDFYYTEYEKDIEVNHIMVDKNGYVKAVVSQTMPAGSTATEVGVGTINRLNYYDKYIKEVYQKRMGRDIIVYRRPSNALGNEFTIDYYGFEAFDHIVNVKDIVGTNRMENIKGTKEVSSVQVGSGYKQVNFYYCIEQEIPYPEPEKDIEGKVFVEPVNRENEDISKVPSSSCEDSTEAISVTSIPTTSYAKVGIKGIPRYMVGAIYTKYSPPTEPTTLKINVNLKYGSQNKTITYTGFKYKAGYYRVTDMLVYELQNQTIYDANNGEHDTLGEKIFNWNSKTLSKTDIANMWLSVSLTGINGRKINNTVKDIENINNYVSVSVKDKHGAVSGSGASNSTFSKTFLTESQIKEVDATNYDPIEKSWDKSINEAEYAVINDKDKSYSDTKYNGYTNSLNTAKTNTNNSQNALEDAKTTLDNLNKSYNDATDTLSKKQEAYDKEKQIMIANKKAYDDQVASLNNYDKLIEEKNKELDEAKAVEQEKLAIKDTMSNNLQDAENEKNRLYKDYTDKVAERNNLQANANCTDTVPDEVYIYMEQPEKDELEKCKEAKRKYQENLDNKVVEIARDKYLSYLDGEYQTALDQLNEATNEYNSAVSDRQDIESQLSQMNLTRLGKYTMVLTLQKTYEDHLKGEYKTAKEDLESYTENEYKTAKEKYEKYIEEKHIEQAEEKLTEAKKQQEKAQQDWNTYNDYRKNLYEKYDNYKAQYEEYVSLINKSSEDVASMLDLQVQIKVQNMSITVQNGTLKQNLFKEGTDVNNSVTQTINLNDYAKSNKVLEIYTSRPEIDKSLYSSIGGTLIKPTDYLLDNNRNSINSDRLNGVRVLSGNATYKTKVLIGDTNVKSIKDNVYYSEFSTEDKTAIFNLENGREINREYKYKNSTDVNEKYKLVDPINIYTPIGAAAELKIDDTRVVNQSNSDTDNLSVIQLNTPFTLNLTNNKKDAVYSNMDNTNKYRGGFYVKFSFDVHKVKINGKTYKSGGRIAAGTWIGIITNNSKGKAYIEAQPYANLSDNRTDLLSEENSTYTVRAVAFNATKIMLDNSIKYKTLEEMKGKDSDLADSIYNKCNETSYFDEIESDVVIMNRVYDFRITDLKDLDWKNVFRSKKTTVNAHTKNVYYAGNTKWNYTSDKSNSIVSRTSSEIGRNPLRILPLGPYKNTNTSYIKAPKMGYRFSFDMKVTGSYYKNTDKVANTENMEDIIRTDKKVNITTKFYYISKDGKNYYPEYTNGNSKGIYLFYKNDSGQYIRIDEQGGGYELTFTPNDGYRLIEDSITSTLATKKVSLGNLRHVVLNYQMATVTDNSSAITYYGDYKLPNSTIAVLVNEDGTYNINKPLKDGYIGVIFGINVYSGTAKTGENANKDIILSYDKDTKQAENTSQWDYEGFLGYTRVGSSVKEGEINIKLEKGKWQITNDIYKAIKGTVILYDIDQRAATDYE